MASSHDATSPWDLLQGLVAGTSPIVCAVNVYVIFPKNRKSKGKIQFHPWLISIPGEDLQGEHDYSFQENK